MGQEMCPVKGKHGFWEFRVCWICYHN